MNQRTINIFYQLEAARAQHHVESTQDELLKELRERIIQKHNLQLNVLFFKEDEDQPAELSNNVGSIADSKGSRVHLHRCPKIAASVAFGGRLLERTFGPGTTIAQVKRWAVKELQMSEDDAGEHVLQIAGTHDRPSPSTHLGSLVMHPKCHVAFDLVADERVQG